MTSAAEAFIDFGDAEGLSRSELQKALKHYGLPSGGTNVVLRERYQLYRNSQIANTAIAPAVAVAAKKPPSAKNMPAAAKTKTAAPPEKRLCRYRKSCPKPIQQRIDRAKTQRMYLVRKDDAPQTKNDNMTCQFVILGSTGNVYTVEIGKRASCTCPDHAKGNLCKHILFVLLKVMAIDPSSPLIYQAAWLESEVREMFDQMSERYRRVSGTVLANSTVRAKFAKLEKGGDEDDDEDALARRQQVQEDDDCPICLDSLQGGGGSCKTTFCRGRCGANFHQICINQWLQQHRSKPTCPNCREAWDEGKPSKEGFTNLGKLQGQSQERDTSTYSSWFQGYHPNSKKRRYW